MASGEAEVKDISSTFGGAVGAAGAPASGDVKLGAGALGAARGVGVSDLFSLHARVQTMDIANSCFLIK
jgi:hypothetical protein